MKDEIIINVDENDNEIGFIDIKYYSDFEEYNEDCERIIFVCRKG